MSKTIHQSRIQRWVLSVIHAYDKTESQKLERNKLMAAVLLFKSKITSLLFPIISRNLFLNGGVHYKATHADKTSNQSQFQF